MLGFLKRLTGGAPTAAKQQGDVHALDREAIRVAASRTTSTAHADPRTIVEDGVAMKGPAGAPQEETAAEDRPAMTVPTTLPRSSGSGRSAGSRHTRRSAV